ncbi:ankyrin repeat and protein kinase domain-containing protein 1 [Fagus crenata]
MASTIDQINPDPEMEYVKKNLFKIAMQGKWEKVVEIYRTNPMAHKAKLTRSGDTALHIAISDGQEERVEELVGSIISIKRESKEIKEEAFLYLHELCGTKNGYNYCRRKDGDTILHCAISGDNFGIFVDELENEPSDHQNQNLEVLEIEREASDLNFKEIIIDEHEPKNSLRKN